MRLPPWLGPVWFEIRPFGSFSEGERPCRGIPSIVAGAEGRVAFLYVGSKVPGGWSASAEDMGRATWDAYVGFTMNALDARPVIATTTGNPAGDPLRRGPCEGRCSPDPNDCIIDCLIGSPSVGMFDYLELALDPKTGRVAASLVDLCDQTCAADAASAGWSFIGAVAVQVAGPTLT